MPGNDRRGAAPANFLDWRRESRAFSSLAAAEVLLSRTLAALLFNVAPTDDLVLGGAAALLAAVAIGAGLLPARRAAAVDTAVALPAE